MKLLEDREEVTWRWRTWEFESEPHVPLRLHLLTQTDRPVRDVVLEVLDSVAWQKWDRATLKERWEFLPPRDRNESAAAFLECRGIGSGAWPGDAREQVHIRRRFMLLGQSLDGMRVWDIVRASEALRLVAPDMARLEVTGEGMMSVNVLLSSLFSTNVAGVRLRNSPVSYEDSPDYLNVLSVLRLKDAMQLARRRGVEVALTSAAPVSEGSGGN